MKCKVCEQKKERIKRMNKLSRKYISRKIVETETYDIYEGAVYVSVIQYDKRGELISVCDSWLPKNRK